jgi:hypothetical protein
VALNEFVGRRGPIMIIQLGKSRVEPWMVDWLPQPREGNRNRRDRVPPRKVNCEAFRYPKSMMDEMLKAELAAWLPNHPH